MASPARPSDGMTKTEGEWLAQVEILTHAPPPRRIWMGPQFSFKTYQASFTSSLQATPPLQADSMVDSGEGSGGSETIKSTNDSAVLPSSEGPLADLLADPLDQSNAVQSIHSNPMSMPLTPGASNTDKERGEPLHSSGSLVSLPFLSFISPPLSPYFKFLFLTFTNLVSRYCGGVRLLEECSPVS